MNKLQLAQDKLNVKRREMAAIFEEYPDMDIPEEKAALIKPMNDEIEELGREVTSLQETERIATKNREAIDSAKAALPVSFAGGEVDEPKSTETKSLGQLFVESAGFKAYRQSKQNFSTDVDVEVKTLVSEGGTGFAPQAIRTGQVIPSAQQMPRIVDVIPAVTTDQIAVVYMRETTFTNAAAETAEGALSPEAALAYTQESQPIQKVSVFLPVTEEQLADIQGMQDRINNRLTLMMRQRLDSQILVGDGNSPNLLGLLNVSGILTQARGTDVNVDAILKGITKVQTTGFAEPNVILMNPTDWQNVRLLKTADGEYVFGPPAMAVAPQIWGLPVVTSTYVTLGTAVPADYAGYTELSFLRGLEFAVSDSHSDFFQRGQLALRATMRCAVVALRPSAICAVSGL